MEKINKSIRVKIIKWINSNMAIAIIIYSLFYLFMFYLFTQSSGWSWEYLIRSLLLGIYSGLFFRLMFQAKSNDWQKRLKISMWIILGAILLFALVENLIKSIS